MTIKLSTVIIAASIATSSVFLAPRDANAGLLNYWRMLALACIAEDYDKPVKVRAKSIELSDAVREISHKVIDLTRIEEHWSLAKITGNEERAKELHDEMISEGRLPIEEAKKAKQKLSELRGIVSSVFDDAASGNMPANVKNAFSVYVSIQSLGGVQAVPTANYFRTGVEDQFATYASKISETIDALEQAQLVIDESTEMVIGSGVHRTLSDRLRRSVEATISLLDYAENVSEQTLSEGRQALTALEVNSCVSSNK